MSLENKHENKKCVYVNSNPRDIERVSVVVNEIRNSLNPLQCDIHIDQRCFLKKGKKARRKNGKIFSVV